MKIKTLKELENNFEKLTQNEQLSVSGGIGIYNPANPTEYIGDVALGGYITGFYDDDVHSKGAYVGINGSALEFVGDYDDNTPERLYFQGVTEDRKAIYYDYVTAGYVIDQFNQSFAALPFDATMYADQFSGGYVFYTSAY